MTSSSDSDPAIAETPMSKTTKSHIRAYHACNECRRKKHKCDLGPVDDPHEPPCAGCLRENKLCLFSKVRSKISNAQLAGDGSEPGTPGLQRSSADLVINDDCPEKKAKGMSSHGETSTDQSLTLLARLRDIDCTEAMSFSKNSREAAEEIVAVRDLWLDFQFVRESLMSTTEAASWVNFFCSELRPMTATPIADYTGPVNQAQLVKQPLLAIAILLVASRFAAPVGRLGRNKSTVIHHELGKAFDECLGKLMSHRFSFKVDESCRDGCSESRYHTLGNIEALLLLMDWSPRTLDVMTHDDSKYNLEELAHLIEMHDKGRTSAKERRDAFFKPCRKNERLSLVYMKAAIELATDLQLFEKHPLHQNKFIRLPGEMLETTQRRDRIRCALFVQATFLAGRNRMESLYPEACSRLMFSVDVVDAAQAFNEPDSVLDPATSRSPDFARDVAAYFWYRLAFDVIVPMNKDLYASLELSRNLIRTGAYASKMHAHLTELEDLQDTLDNCKSLPKLLKMNLSLDFEYGRVLIVQFGLQATFLRIGESKIDILDDEARTMYLASIIGRDRTFVVEIVKASRKVITIANRELGRAGVLRFAIDRVFIKIANAAMALVSAFILGHSEDECRITFSLLRELVDKLDKCKTGDNHIGPALADGLDGLLWDVEHALRRVTVACQPLGPLLDSAPKTRPRNRRGTSISQSSGKSKKRSTTSTSSIDQTTLSDQIASLSTSAPTPSFHAFDASAASIPEVQPPGTDLDLMQPQMPGEGSMIAREMSDVPAFQSGQPLHTYYSMPMEPLLGAGVDGLFNVDDLYGDFQTGNSMEMVIDSHLANNSAYQPPPPRTYGQGSFPNYWDNNYDWSTQMR